MVLRLSFLIALVAAALPIVRLSRLIRTEDTSAWLFIIAGAFLLGMLATWAVWAYRRSVLLVAGVNVAAVGLIIVTYLAPDTTWGILPTTATGPVVAEELSFALELLRFGTAPVIPVAGLVAALGAIFWLFGAVAAWAVETSRPLAAIGGPAVLYLQLATIDRTPSGPGWIAAFLAVVGAALLISVIEDRRRATGRLHTVSGTMLKRTALARSLAYLSVLVVGATVAGLMVSAVVPSVGLLNWRARSGIGTGIYGGVSYNLFVSTVQTDLISLGDEPVFVARTSEPATARRMFWRLITLERYDGSHWYPGLLSSGDPNRTTQWERGDHKYQGLTRTVDQRVQIRSLRQNYVPHVYSPIDLESDNRVLADSLRVREDGAIKFDALTWEGLDYTIRSVVPDDPVSELASVDGAFSPMFAAAAADGRFGGSPSAARRPLSPPQNIAVFEELPEELDPRIVEKALDLTELGVTDYEKALLLESFYRSPQEFLYSVDIDPGHSATDLASWLFDPESPNFRTGYCEQFATGMAVMARAVGLPSRVVLGFTPGEISDDNLITVRQKNAHAWVELWIDDHGWVQFDPTPRSDGVNPSTSSALAFVPADYAIPLEDELAEADSPGATQGSPFDDEIRIPELLAEREALLNAQAAAAAADNSFFNNLSLPDWWWRIPASSVILVLVPLVKVLRRRWRMRRLLKGDVTAAWNEVTDQLRDAGMWRASDVSTPAEVAESSFDSLDPLARHYATHLWSSSGRVTATMIRESVNALESTEATIRDSSSMLRRVGRVWNPRSVVRQIVSSVKSTRR